jgi:hypothetical protein
MIFAARTLPVFSSEDQLLAAQKAVRPDYSNQSSSAPQVNQLGNNNRRNPTLGSKGCPWLSLGEFI